MRLAVRGAAEAAAISFSVVTTIWVGRTVGPELFGYYAIAGVLVQLGILVSGIGLGQAGSLLVARERMDASRVVAVVGGIRILAAMVLASVVLLFVVVVPVDRTLALLLGLSTPAWIAAALRLDWLFVATGRTNVAAVLRLSGPLGGLVVAISSIHSPDDVAALAALLVVPIAAPALIGTVEASRSGFVRRALLRTSRDEVQTALSHGLHFLRGELGTFVTTSSDRLFLFVFTTPAAVGLYDAAYRIIQPFYSVAAVVNDAYYSRLAAAHDGQRVERSVFRRYVDLSFVATIPVGFVFAVHAETAVEILYGGRFAGAADSLALLGWVITLGFVSGVVIFPLTAFGRPRDYGDAVTAGGVSNVVLNLVLIPPLAGAGAAIATIAAKAASSLIGARAFGALSRYPLLTDLRDYASASLFAAIVSALARAVAGGLPGIVAFGLVYLGAISVLRRDSLRQPVRDIA